MPNKDDNQKKHTGFFPTKPDERTVQRTTSDRGQSPTVFFGEKKTESTGELPESPKETVFGLSKLIRDLSQQLKSQAYSNDNRAQSFGAVVLQMLNDKKTNANELITGQGYTASHTGPSR